MSEVTLRTFVPEDIPWIVDRHRELYARDEGFDDSFGDLVDEILKEFVRDHDPARETGWVAEEDGVRLGTIFCVSAGGTTAKLRLFLLTPEARGKGLGKRLLTTCMNFARDTGYRDMVLWTHESHKAACALYAAFGWRMVDSKAAHSFGMDVVEQHWAIGL